MTTFQTIVSPHTSLLVGVGGAVVYLLFQGPNFRDHSYEHQTKMEETAYIDGRRDASLSHYRSCMSDAKTDYATNWKRQCSLYTKDQVNDCMARGIDATICNTKIVFDADCALPGGRASAVERVKEKSEDQCQAMFDKELLGVFTPPAPNGLLQSK